MIEQSLKSVVLALAALLFTAGGSVGPAPVQAPVAQTASTTGERRLSERSLSLENRHTSPGVNEIFAKNILLNLAYMNGSVTEKTDIQWEAVEAANTFDVTLQPGDTFAYHDHVQPQYEESLTATSRAHFDASEGFLFSGFLYGDGVCHLASIINWAAQDAGLSVSVPKRHGIAPIPDVPAEYGVSIYTVAGEPNSGTGNNLYITNNRPAPVRFSFASDKSAVTVTVSEVTETLAYQMQ